MPLRQGIHETVEQKRTLPTERHAMAADMSAAGISALIRIPVIAFIVLVSTCRFSLFRPSGSIWGK